MLFNGCNFRSYLEDYYFWKDNPIRSKKRFKTILMTLYGKKKDRGGIKKKYREKIEKQNDENQMIMSAVRKVAPSLFSFGGVYD